ncbi:MAG: Regulatory protein AtoC [bacterium]|nr:Regulatory protein AtoC [bacterium]
MKPSILVVDDDAAFRAVTSALLEDEGYAVTCAGDGSAAIALLRERHFDLVLSDLVMADVSGLQVLETAKTLSSRTLVIMVTGFASVESAVEAIKRGAEDYLTKPCGNAELLLKVERALAQRLKDEELARLRDVVAQSHSFGNLIGKSARMQQVFRLAQQVAASDATVLLLGETGTGKELLARALHFNSPRRNGPFVAVNCAAMAETLLESELFGHEKGAFTGAIRQKPGRFEMAEKGTLFLDEVGDIPLVTQIKLLRVLQEREFERVGGSETIKCDIRLVSATNHNLEQLIQEKKFREDLYYRLNVVPVKVPALRERPEDIPLLAQHFLKKYVQALNKPIGKISEAAMNLLLQHKWPGNVRELENLIERAVVLCTGDVVDVEHLLLLQERPEADLLAQARSQQLTERQLTQLYARMILDLVGGNKKEACRVLDLNFRTLQNRLEGLSPETAGETE